MHARIQVLHRLLEPVISALGYELWGLELFSRGNRSLLRVYIDSGTGVSLADCERVSHQITGVLDVEDPIRGSYDLEVSSPGLDRPLFTVDQFRRYIDGEVRIRLKAKVMGRRNIIGTVEAVADELISLRVDGESVSVPVDFIEKARLVPQI
jgi:ribosome maturation factor RimP